MHAIAATTGEQLWNTSVSGANVARRAAAADGRIYMAMPSSEMLARRIVDGVEEWVHAFADGQVGEPGGFARRGGDALGPVLRGPGPGDPGGRRRERRPAWTADLACTLPLDFSPVIDGTRVYVACDAPGGGVEVVGLSLETGAVEMDVTVGDGTLSGELSGANGVLYVGAPTVPARAGRIDRGRAGSRSSSARRCPSPPSRTAASSSAPAAPSTHWRCRTYPTAPTLRLAPRVERLGQCPGIDHSSAEEPAPSHSCAAGLGAGLAISRLRCVRGSASALPRR